MSDCCKKPDSATDTKNLESFSQAQITFWDMALNKYRPVTVLLLLALASSYSISAGWDIAWMPLFMGMVFILFSLFKLLDVKGFAQGYIQYDILAQRFPVYATLYPFIELALALLYLSGTCLFVTNLVTLAVMLVGLMGIVKHKDDGLKCACVGAKFDLPLGVVTIAENGLMALMAFIALL